MKPMYQSDPFTRRLPGATSSAIWILSLLALVEVGVMANATSYNPGMGAVAEDVQSGSNIDDVPTVSEASPSCNDILRLPVGEDRCAFARAHCPSEGVLPYFVMYHCYVAPCGVLPAMLTYTSLAAFLCLLFYVMGRAADEYFSSILSQISQDMGLPPRLAGVTLLALGNGAPDLSSSIAAVRAGHYHLALGALTGGSMFVGCVVAGRIIVTSDGVKCRGAQIRDVMMQFMAVALIVAISKMQKSLRAINFIATLCMDVPFHEFHGTTIHHVEKRCLTHRIRTCLLFCSWWRKGLLWCHRSRAFVVYCLCYCRCRCRF